MTSGPLTPLPDGCSEMTAVMKRTAGNRFRGWLVALGVLVLATALLVTGAVLGFFDDFESGEWVALVSALATAVSAMVIAWQSRETSRAADASSRAADAAVVQAEMTQRSLSLTRDAFHENVKLRLDAQAANVIPRYDLDRGFSVYRRRQGTEVLTRMRPDEALDLPQDNGDWLYVHVPVTLSNASNVPVTVTGDFSSSSRDAKGNPADWRLRREVHLAANESESFNMLVGNWAHLWAEYRQDALQSGTQDGFTAGWSTRIPATSGVSMVGRVRVRGSVLRPGDRQGRWVLIDPSDVVNNPLSLEALPVQRDYYLDHTNGTRVGPSPH